jgi:hypothetical protein
LVLLCQEWEAEQKRRQEALTKGWGDEDDELQEEEAPEDDLPFACYICRQVLGASVAAAPSFPQNTFELNSSPRSVHLLLLLPANLETDCLPTLAITSQQPETKPDTSWQQTVIL